MVRKIKRMNKNSSTFKFIAKISIIFVFFLTSNFSCSFVKDTKSNKELAVKQDYAYLYANPSRNAVYDSCSTSINPKVKWKREAGSSFPIAYNDLVFIGYESRLSNPYNPYTSVYPGHTYALDIETGKVVWEKEADFGTITISDGIIYFLGEAGEHYAVEAKTGKNLWSINVKRSFSDPIVCEDLVYVGCKDAIYAFNIKTGEEAWKYKEEGKEFSNLVLADDKIACHSYYPYADFEADDYWIYRDTSDSPDLLILDAKTGKKIKRYKSVLFHGFDENNFYIERRDVERKISFLIALDRKTDKENWRF